MIDLSGVDTIKKNSVPVLIQRNHHFFLRAHFLILERYSTMTCSNSIHSANNGRSMANFVIPDSIPRGPIPEEALPHSVRAGMSRPLPSGASPSFGDLRITLNLIDCALAILENAQFQLNDEGDLTDERVRRQ
jgi:hypothetical protein